MTDTEEKKMLWYANAIGNTLDEYFSPKHTNPALETIVEQDMRAMGYDPTSSQDVKEYWKSKGINA
jgi:hypothetical protein